MLLNDFEIERESDLYTGEIFKVPNAHFLPGTISRLVTDLNRSPEHIEMEYQLASDGAVVSINENGEPIYKEAPDIDSIYERIKKYHDPFHEKIEALKPEIKFLIDGHSMLSKGPSTKQDSKQKRPEVCVGNMLFMSCGRALSSRILKFFQEKGLEVMINKPYEGRYILNHHCSRMGLNGVTIEFNRKLYMNEKTLQPKSGKIKELNQLIHELVDVIGIELESNQL